MVMGWWVADWQERWQHEDQDQEASAIRGPWPGVKVNVGGGRTKGEGGGRLPT